MKKLLSLFVLSTVLLTACKKNNNEQGAAPDPQQDLLSTQQINDAIINDVKTKGDYDWKYASDKMLWSALQHSDKIICVGYKPLDEGDIDSKMSSININDAK